MRETLRDSQASETFALGALVCVARCMVPLGSLVLEDVSNGGNQPSRSVQSCPSDGFPTRLSAGEAAWFLV